MVGFAFFKGPAQQFSYWRKYPRFEVVVDQKTKAKMYLSPGMLPPSVKRRVFSTLTPPSSERQIPTPTISREFPLLPSLPFCQSFWLSGPSFLNHTRLHQEEAFPPTVDRPHSDLTWLQGRYPHRIPLRSRGPNCWCSGPDRP